MDSNTLAATPPFGTTPVAPVSDALYDATLDLLATDDAGAIAGKALSAAGRVLVVEGTSIWVPSGDLLHCRGAIGEQRERLSGVSVAPDVLLREADDRPAHAETMSCIVRRDVIQDAVEESQDGR